MASSRTSMGTSIALAFALSMACILSQGARAAPLPYEVPDSVGPFLRFGSVDDYYRVSVLAAAKGEDVAGCLELQLVSGLATTAAGPQQINVTSEELDTYGEYTFIRWRVVLELGTEGASVVYKIASTCPAVVLVNATAAEYTVAVPSATEAWHWSYISCNGFHDLALAPIDGIRPLWEDLWAQHTQKPLHLLAANGDQIYNDPYFTSDPTIEAAAKNSTSTDTVVNWVWTEELLQHTNDFFFSSYAHHYMLDSPDFQRALASIPFTMMWDDHDGFNGMGSQIDVVRSSPFYTELVKIATRFFLLFQQHSTLEKLLDDVAWTTQGYSQVSRIGPSTALFALDERTERTPLQVASNQTYDEVFARLDELPEGISHLVVLSSQPIAMSTRTASDRVLDSQAFSDAGLTTWPQVQEAFQSAAQKPPLEQVLAALDEPMRFLFGAPDLSDLVDQWDSRHHEVERGQLISRLQGWAADRGARVTFLSGDAHIPFASELSTAAATPAPVNDIKYMVSAVSSAIGNEPSPVLAKLLELTSLTYSEYTDATQETALKMAPVFRLTPGFLLSQYTIPRRNYMLVSELEGDKAGYLELTWRLENYDNATEELAVVTRTLEVPPYVAA